MNIRYKVLGVHKSDTEVEATLSDGRKVAARVPCYIVDCQSEDGAMAHTFKVHEEPACKEGDVIEGQFSVVEPALDLNSDEQTISEADVGTLDLSAKH